MRSAELKNGWLPPGKTHRSSPVPFAEIESNRGSGVTDVSGGSWIVSPDGGEEFPQDHDDAKSELESVEARE